MAGEPRSSASRLAGTVRRAALAAGEDLLRPAPSSALNARIGPRRRLVRHTVPIEDVLIVKRRLGVTLNDVCLAMAAGGLRRLAVARGDPPRPLKTMVPVNVRGEGEDASLGNRISFAFIDLPLDVASPERRLARIHMAGERRGHLLQTTALVNEAYIRLVDARRVRWRDRTHFFAMVAR